MTRRRKPAPGSDTPMTDYARRATGEAPPTFRTVTGPGWTLIHGDCSDVLASLAPESIDAIVTDPPAGISFMGREWDGDKGGRDQWIAWLAGIMRKAIVALKPGGHALVWALPRTSHWTATAIEDAGFEIRDVGIHLFGTGFPKSLDVSKAIDDSLDADRVPVLVPTKPRNRPAQAGPIALGATGMRDTSDPVTPEAARFVGIGTALKPAAEHWILCRKPLEGTVAANVLKFGTGGLNIDACRIGTGDNLNGGAYSGERRDASSTTAFAGRGIGDYKQPDGRWPAHLTLAHSSACEGERCAPGCPVAILDEQSGTLTSGSTPMGKRDGSQGTVYGASIGPRCLTPRDGNEGGASRFFYVAKAPRREKDAGLDHLPLRTGGEATDREEGSAGLNSPRAGTGRTGGVRNHHPTVKSVDLMRWLCRLVTPRGGTVLDLFAGSGTTGLAALAEGLRFVGIERSPEKPGDPNYIDIAAGRLAHATCQPTPDRIVIDEDEKPAEKPAQPSLFDTLRSIP